ncbi:DUF6722 family protein [Capnocytophaga stomatis]|uniref:DUF6722 family protein n=1 Tax=Capnocytophaga stomatis TaxID=1848904 RepID=UPI00194F062E|nr:DUF6722 family protein [Capnocytophaga stomatis]
MKKEFGKWLLDVAKYVATAVIVSDIFTEIDGKNLYVTAGITTTIMIICGLLLIREKKPLDNKKNHKKRK